MPNFGCRISPKGAKSFIVLVASGRRKTIGRYPIISLAKAHLEAKRILAEKTLGKEAMPSISVADALAIFLVDSEKRHKCRTARDYKRLLLRHLAKLMKAELDRVSTRDIAHITDRMRDTPSEAAHALVAIKVFFNWCVRRSYVAANPCEHLTTPKSSPRDRVLTDAEVKTVYQQAATFRYPFGAIVQLLILTGQRRGEIGLLQWKWIDGKSRTITFPAEATKNNRSHTFPFGNIAAHILASLPFMSEYAFPATRETRNGVSARGVNGWSHSKTAFDKRTQGVDAEDFVNELRAMKVTPHVAQNASGRSSAIGGRTTRHGGYAASQNIRKRIEEAFGSIKTLAGQEKTKFRGRNRVGWAFTFAAAAHNLTRLPKLLAAPT